jgi:hypothetical protein
VKLAALVDEGREVGVEGDAEGLIQMASGLESGDVTTLELQRVVDTRPWGGSLLAVEIQPRAGPVRVDLLHGRLVISGDPAGLATLGANVRSLASEEWGAPSSRPHVHAEYFPGHPFFDPTAMPLTFTLGK